MAALAAPIAVALVATGTWVWSCRRSGLGIKFPGEG